MPDEKTNRGDGRPRVESGGWLAALLLVLILGVFSLPWGNGQPGHLRFTPSLALLSTACICLLAGWLAGNRRSGLDALFLGLGLALLEIAARSAFNAQPMAGDIAILAVAGLSVGLAWRRDSSTPALWALTAASVLMALPPQGGLLPLGLVGLPFLWGLTMRLSRAPRAHVLAMLMGHGLIIYSAAHGLRDGALWVVPLAAAPVVYGFMCWGSGATPRTTLILLNGFLFLADIVVWTWMGHMDVAYLPLGLAALGFAGAALGGDTQESGLSHWRLSLAFIFASSAVFMLSPESTRPLVLALTALIAQHIALRLGARPLASCVCVLAFGALGAGGMTVTFTPPAGLFNPESCLLAMAALVLFMSAGLAERAQPRHVNAVPLLPVLFTIQSGCGVLLLTGLIQASCPTPVALYVQLALTVALVLLTVLTHLTSAAIAAGAASATTGVLVITTSAPVFWAAPLTVSIMFAVSALWEVHLDPSPSRTAWTRRGAALLPYAMGAVVAVFSAPHASEDPRAAGIMLLLLASLLAGGLLVTRLPGMRTACLLCWWGGLGCLAFAIQRSQPTPGWTAFAQGMGVAAIGVLVEHALKTAEYQVRSLLLLTGPGRGLALASGVAFAALIMGHGAATFTILTHWSALAAVLAAWGYTRSDSRFYWMAAALGGVMLGQVLIAFV